MFILASHKPLELFDGNLGQPYQECQEKLKVVKQEQFCLQVL